MSVAGASATRGARSAAPAGAAAPGVDVRVRLIIAPARVQPQSTRELGVRLLDDIHRPCDELEVGGGEPSIAVGIDRDVGGVAILVAAVLGGAAHAAVVG